MPAAACFFSGWSTGGIDGGGSEPYEMIDSPPGMETIDGEFMEPGGSGTMFMEPGVGETGGMGGDFGDTGGNGQSEPYEMIDDGGTEVYILE